VRVGPARGVGAPRFDFAPFLRSRFPRRGPHHPPERRGS
jgi:hypothetical protein